MGIYEIIYRILFENYKFGKDGIVSIYMIGPMGRVGAVTHHPEPKVKDLILDGYKYFIQVYFEKRKVIDINELEKTLSKFTNTEIKIIEENKKDGFRIFLKVPPKNGEGFGNYKYLFKSGSDFSTFKINVGYLNNNDLYNMASTFIKNNPNCTFNIIATYNELNIYPSPTMLNSSGIKSDKK